MRKSRLKTAAVLACGLLALGGAGAAYAYWTTGGAGTGSAATGTSAAIVANQTSVVTGMGPGVAAQPLSGDFDNGNAAPTYVSTVTASIGSVTGGDGVCATSNYTLANAAMAVNASVPVGVGVGAWGGATIAFNNDPDTNQDACKNATVNLVYTIS